MSAARTSPCQDPASQETGHGKPIEQEWYEDLLTELTGKFGGATSFMRAPGRGLWWSGGEIQRDNIAVIEVMAGRLQPEYWRRLRERLKRQLSQEEVFRLLVLRYSGKRSCRARTATNWKELTPEERRDRRELRREKQREDNIGRAAKMHTARLRMEAESPKSPPELKQSVYVGCSGWRYWKWRDSFYVAVPQENWFEHYLKRFDTVEINASFYSWPTVANVQAWRR
jgi:hypothetical protein